MFEKLKLKKLMQEAAIDGATLDELVVTKQVDNYTEAVDYLNNQESEIFIQQIAYNLGHDSILGF